MENLDKPVVQHYYGDTVRRLFVLGGLIMILTLPFFTNLLPVPLFISILAIVVVAIVAGATNPLQKSVAWFNLVTAAVAFLVFEYYAVDAYMMYSADSVLFFTNQILALIFFFAVYFSTKTLRGKLL